MKAKLYDHRDNVIEIVDCNDIDRITHSCYGDGSMFVYMRNHDRKLCWDFVFMMEGEE